MLYMRYCSLWLISFSVSFLIVITQSHLFNHGICVYPHTYLWITPHSRWIIRLAVVRRICIQLQLRTVSERDKEMARPSEDTRITARNSQEEESACIRYTRGAIPVLYGFIHDIDVCRTYDEGTHRTRGLPDDVRIYLIVSCVGVTHDTRVIVAFRKLCNANF